MSLGFSISEVIISGLVAQWPDYSKVRMQGSFVSNKDTMIGFTAKGKRKVGGIGGVDQGLK